MTNSNSKEDPEYEDKQKMLYAVMILSQGNTTFGINMMQAIKLCSQHTVEELREMVEEYEYEYEYKK